MLLVHEIKLPVQGMPEQAYSKAAAVLKLPPSAIQQASIHKISVDARRKEPFFVYSVAVTLKDPAREAAYEDKGPGVQWIQYKPFILRPGSETLDGPVVVCGFGPAGLFAALELAKQGFEPLVLERGPELSRRRKAVEAFEAGGELDENANIQFGEGGAGTFSDGKLTTRIRDPLCGRVTEYLLDAGAPQEIAFKNKPHVGTDLLQDVLVNLRRQLLSLGGRVLFDTCLTGLVLKNGRIAGVKTSAGEMACSALVLAIGHSARDTFAMLHSQEAAMEPKVFSVGFRAEHLQSGIEKGLYHSAAGHPALPAGEYQLSSRHEGRGVYTFCMCPGGQVVAAQSEKNTVVTNGMSYHARNGLNANAAVVANVGPEDFGPGALAGIRFQQQLERAAFSAGGAGYEAPAETLGSFLRGEGRLALGRVLPTYPRGVRPADLGSLLPAPVASALRAGLAAFGRKLPGYGDEDAVLTGLETRTSSPVRLLRKEDMESQAIPGLWPCGEGAGYAGGIMSAAVDGIRTAIAIAERYAPRNG